MKIALIGYGRMGKTIEALGLREGHTFPLVVDVDNIQDLNKKNLLGVEVAIEFTTPGTAPDNIIRCFELGIPVVSGTTGWNDRFGEIESACRDKSGTFFYASNFSIGVNILFAMNKQLARIMEKFPEYRVFMEEVHHIHKLDAPSGTAITLAGQIMDEQERIKRWNLEKTDDPSQIHIHAIREGEVKGKHTIRYESAQDSVTIAHDAKSRDVFAAGVLMAASYIKGRSGVFGMSDMLNI